MPHASTQNQYDCQIFSCGGLYIRERYQEDKFPLPLGMKNMIDLLSHQTSAAHEIHNAPGEMTKTENILVLSEDIRNNNSNS